MSDLLEFISHTALAYFLKNLVMANGLADHEVSPHCAMQWPSMLRLDRVKGNGKGQS